MTRIAVLADIHGNLPALVAVIEDMAQFDVDQVVVAGDSINWGPYSAQVVERIVNENWAVIRGNNELYLLDFDTPRAPEVWKAYEALPWFFEHLREWQSTIACWPDTLQLRFSDAPPVRVFHGIPGNPWEAIFPNTPEEDVRVMLAGVEEKTLICAHNHLIMDRPFDLWHILNPGSVGVGLDGNRDASYMILEGQRDCWVATARRVPYDRSPIFAEFERLGFLDHTGITGHIVIEEFRTARLIILPFWEWCRLEHPDEEPSRTLLDEFLTVDPHPYLPTSYAELL